MAAPRHHEKSDASWHKGQARVYGRMRKIRYQRALCQWSVSGYEQRVHAFVLEVEGYDRPWFVVTAALDLSGEQVAEAFATGRWLSGSQTTHGYGGMSGLDQGTRAAYVPGADGGDDAVTPEAISLGRRLGRYEDKAKSFGAGGSSRRR